MGTRVARLESELTLNDVSFANGIKNAERLSEGFAARFESRFESLFKRSPGRKAERALSGLVGDLTSGNIAGAVANFGGKISGLGLGIGLALGAGIEIFEKFHDHIVKVTEDTEALHDEMAKPVNLIAGLSADAIGAQAEAIKAKYGEIVKDHKGFLHTIVNMGKDLLGGYASTPQDVKDQILENEGYSTFQERQKLQGQSELERANARKTTSGDSTQSQLTELYFKSREKQNEIELQGGKGAADRIKALKLDEERLTDEIVHRGEVRERELKAEEKLARLDRSALPDQKKKIAAAGLRLSAINDALSDPSTTKDERSTLQIQKIRAENDVRDLTKGTRNPFVAGTIASRDWEDKNGAFGSVQSRINEMNDPNAFGSMAYNAMNRGEIAKPEGESGDVPDLLQKILEITTQAWGAK